MMDLMAILCVEGNVHYRGNVMTVLCLRKY